MTPSSIWPDGANAGNFALAPGVPMGLWPPDTYVTFALTTIR
ncbi:hypothetical protein [Sulfitobacter sp. M22]|nr:hypothetical protein [Sulfitobacter sp. M22]